MESKIKTMTGIKIGKKDPEVVTTKLGAPVETDGTSVYCATGVTISKNYNSVKLEVGVTYPTTRGNIKTSAAKVWDIVDEELEGRIKEANAFLDKI